MRSPKALAYGYLVPKSEKKASEFRPIKVVMVRCKEVGCSSKYINIVLCRDLQSTQPSTIKPSQKEFVLYHSKAAYLGSIRYKKHIDLGLLISQKRTMRAKQRQTSLPFPILITELCRSAGLPWDAVRDIEVTPLSSTDIRHRATYDVDAPEISLIPSGTTGEVQTDATSDKGSDAETAKEQITVHDDEVFDDLVDLENAMYETACKKSLRDAAIGRSSGDGPLE
ncbi:hypothetical protein H5410_031975 [Solanum commersonii]|uniref:Putative plant transposon protein domain-containing protein n=1 Tax=Solanum commersonii TaxID=4109 RepID=A0A9J5YKT4_SOLCO|nr:hypothetical protein H5410_031975 [Solanum commersonii]